MRIKQKNPFGGITLSLLLIISLALIPSLIDVNAQSDQINVKSTTFDKTTILEFENESNIDIDEIRIWLSPGVKFESFKSEEGWTGTKNPAGVIVFTTQTPIESGEIVKFGVKTDTAAPKIIWKSVDVKEQTSIGIAEPNSLNSGGGTTPPDKIDPDDPVNDQDDPGNDQDTTLPDVMSPEALIRLIPDTPKVGDTVRVVGTGFLANEMLTFYVDTAEINSFETDSGGNFVITYTISDEMTPSRVDFIVRDSSDNEKTSSLRISEQTKRTAPDASIPLEIIDLPESIDRGDTMTIGGTAIPKSTITIQIMDSANSLITARPHLVDDTGAWMFDGLIPQDAPYGSYEIIVTDGITRATKSWMIESTKTIEITSEKLKFKRGDLLIFNGTAVPDQPIHFVLKDPLDAEISSDIKQVSDDGYVDFVYQTKQSSKIGTYVLIATQGDSREIILTGLDVIPEELLVIDTDKLNYNKGDAVIVNIDGPASTTLALLVIDPSDKQAFADNDVKLGPNGKTQYSFNIGDDYSKGVFALVVSKGNTKTTTLFSVGLKFGTGPINLLTTKTTYQASESLLVLGKADSNILIKLELTDPQGNVVDQKQTFTNKDKNIEDGSFRIPSDAQIGTWQVKATSGSNFETIDFEVVEAHQEGTVVKINSIKPHPGGGLIVDFQVIGAQNTVELVVTNESGQIVAELSTRSSSEGLANQFWIVPKDQPLGLYTVTASDDSNTATAQFTLE